MIGNEKYMLTVDHFIRREEEACTNSKISTLTSPSLLDVEELRGRLRQKIRELSCKAETLSSSDRIPLGSAIDQLFGNGINEELKHYKRFLDDLHQEQDFHLGKVYCRCEPDSIRRDGESTQSLGHVYFPSNADKNRQKYPPSSTFR